MASTTLNTFFLPAPDFPVRSVEMKGSWDIFEKSYQLKKDSQTGNWRCCHAFENIVCDGATLETSASRDGGLMMGGTYWYYYIIHTIDGDLETFSEGEPKTRSCPLLPGQTMNVLDVPVQANLIAGRNVSSTSIDSLVFTLDPKDKYLPPGVRRAATTSAIKQRKARMTAAPKIVHRAASTPLQSESPPKTPTSSRAGQTTLRPQRSLMSIIQRMRLTRSAGSNSKSSLAWPRRIFSRTGQSATVEVPEVVPEVPKLPNQMAGVPVIAKDLHSRLSVQLPSTALSTGRAPRAATETVEQSAVVAWPQESTLLGDYQPDSLYLQDPRGNGDVRSVIGSSESSFESRTSTPLEQLMAHNSFFAEFSAVVGSNVPQTMQEYVATLSSQKDSATEMILSKLPAHQQASAGGPSYEPRSDEEQQHLEDRSYTTTFSCRESSAFSYARSEDLSPGLASNTTHSSPMSPLHLSQPETPTMSDFEEDCHRGSLQLQRYSQTSVPLALDHSPTQESDALRPPSRAPPPPPPKVKPMTPRSALSGFQGYSLSQDDHKSVLTIRKLPSTTLKTSDARPPFPLQSSKQDLIHSWNDGSEQLLDDLGYLGELII